jgi:hypothetical protein
MKKASLRTGLVLRGHPNSQFATLDSSRRATAPSLSNIGCLGKGAAMMSLAVLLSACAMEGDFGRPKTYRLLGYPLDATYWASDATHISGPRRYSLTPDEIAMRETGYRLRIQIHNLTPVKLAYAPESAYAGTLTYEQRSFGPARVTLFDQELRADHEALTRFGQAARRVLALTARA